MKFLGRRLKRFFLLKREKLDFIGGVELVLPNRLSGWVIPKSYSFDEVRLYLGNNLISKTPINLKRDDVYKLHNISLNCGFQLMLPDNIPDEVKGLKPKVVAINFLDSKSYALNLLSKKSTIEKNISEILKNNLLGSIGHFDGFIENKLQGWASKKGNKKKLNVWMQCYGKPPIKVLCDKYRGDLNNQDINQDSGFQVDINKIPKDWFSKEIFFSFDYSGLIKLPQTSSIIINSKDNILKNKESNLVGGKQNSKTLLKDNKFSSEVPKLSQIEQTKDLDNISLTLSRLESLIENIEANAKKKDSQFNLIKKLKLFDRE